jgi:hypothetical protein
MSLFTSDKAICSHFMQPHASVQISMSDPRLDSTTIAMASTIGSPKRSFFFSSSSSSLRVVDRCKACAARSSRCQRLRCSSGASTGTRADYSLRASPMRRAPSSWTLESIGRSRRETTDLPGQSHTTVTMTQVPAICSMVNPQWHRWKLRLILGFPILPFTFAFTSWIRSVSFFELPSWVVSRPLD